MSGETRPSRNSLPPKNVRTSGSLSAFNTRTSLKKVKHSLESNASDLSGSLNYEDTQDHRQATSSDESSMEQEMTPLVLQTSIIQGVYGLRRTTVPITKRSRASCWTEEHPSPHIAHYTRMQVCKMANREIPWYRLDKEPKATHAYSFYSSWIQKKKHLQEELMAGVKLEEKTAAREKADVSMGWNKVAAGILKKSDDGRRQSKPDLSDLPKRPITADPTKQCSKGISRHKVTLAENEPMLLQRPITKSSKRPKSSDASKRSVMFTSGTRGVERPMSSSGSIHWRKQMGYPPQMTKRQTRLLSGNKNLKKQDETEADARLSQRRRTSFGLKIMKRWKTACRLTITVLRIGRIMAKRSYELDQQVNSFLDFYEVARRDLGEAKGHYIDVDKYKARKELMICSDVQETLRQVPEARTLSQLDQAVRELQKVEVFAQFPRDIQEKVIRRAEYLKLGPRRVIIRKGHKATHFYIIASGTAVVRRVATDPNTGEKKVKKIDFLRPGMTFGEIALISNIPRTGNVMSHDHMQLITVHAEDYVDIFVSTGPGHLISPHLPFLQNLDIMKGWPIQQLLHHPKYCSVRYFKRNVVITHDSKNSPNIYIVRSGHLKVFRFLDWPDDIDPEKSKKFSSTTTDESETSMAFDLIHKPECSRMNIPYRKDKSEHVFWKTIISPRGKRFQWPVVRLTNIHDPLLIRKLKKPDRPKFIPMKILRQEDIFGLDQVPLFKQRRNSRSVILVSLGADCIVLDKKWFCRWAVGETSELLNCTTIQYSDDFIKNRLKDQGNRDVYLEHVLDSYFVKLFRESSGDTNI